METITLNGVEYAPVVEKVQDGKLTYCLVRTYSAGVFAGWYDLSTKGKEGVVFNARRIWRWAGAATLSQLSQEGTKKPDECRFPAAVPEEYLKEIIEVIPCSQAGKESIEGVVPWKE